MAQQPATSSRSGTSAILAMVSRTEPEAEMLSVPLDLRPLLEPYKSHKKLMLRVERVPQRTRLSAGQNNGDQSWSIASDELDNLCYLLPADMQEAHSLSIRVISTVDGGTVAVLSYLISPADGVPEAPRSAPGPRAVPSPSGDAEIRALRSELAQAKAALAASEADAGANLKDREEAWKQHTRELVEAALKKARAEYDAEFSGRLKEVAERAEQTIVARRTAWQSELDASNADSTKRAEQARAEARASARREADAALAQAREGWKSEEAQRLAAAESRWREEARAAASGAQARLHKAEQDAAELLRLRERLAATEKVSDGRARELENARNALNSARESVQHESEAALIRAKAGWASEEAKRLAELEARLRTESDAALGEAAARRERAERALSEAVKQVELLSARRTEAGAAANDEATGLRADLASAHAALAQVREQGVKDLEARLDEARTRWKREEEARLAEVEARFRTQSSTASGEASDLKARADTALAELRGKSLLLEAEEQKRRDLETQLRTLEASLKTRDADKALSQQGTEAALANARKEWSAGEAVRLAQAEARLRAEQERALADSASRAEQAERQLAESRTNSRERVENLKLRDELEKVRLTLEMRDLELTTVRKEFQPASFGAETAPALAPLKRGRMAMRDDPVEKGEEQQRKNRSLVRDIVLVAAVIFLIALVPLSRPWVEPLLPYSLQDELDQTFGDLYVAQPQAPAHHAAAAAPAAPVLPVETVLRAVSLHSAPSKASTVLATLSTGAKVVPLETQGNWVHVSVGDTQNGQQGWVYSAYLSASGR